MRHLTLFCPLLLAASFIACGSDDTPNIPTQPTPVTITQSFSDTLNINGARTHSFTVDRAGTVSAQVKALSDQAATLGVSLGTFNGVACMIIISNTAAVLNTTVTGTAQSTGQFCVWVNDVGKLTAGLDYTIDVTHY
jgi:hypothetical protein